jgi:hypothetical protein
VNHLKLKFEALPAAIPATGTAHESLAVRGILAPLKETRPVSLIKDRANKIYDIKINRLSNTN